MKDWKILIVAVIALMSVFLNVLVLVQVNRNKSEIEIDLSRISRSISSGLADRPKTRGAHPELGIGTKASIIQSNVGSILSEIDVSEQAAQAVRGTFGRETIGSKVLEIEDDISDIKEAISAVRSDMADIRRNMK